VPLFALDLPLLCTYSVLYPLRKGAEFDVMVRLGYTSVAAALAGLSVAAPAPLARRGTCFEQQSDI
jgi:hypothetical protein